MNWYKKATQLGQKLESNENKLRGPKSPYNTLTVTEYIGTKGKLDHRTRNEIGTIPTKAISNIQGGTGEIRGQHRNIQGKKWEDFKKDIQQNGIQYPITITKYPGKEPIIWEGNHRLDAAIELNIKNVPVEIWYWGGSEEEGLAYELV